MKINLFLAFAFLATWGLQFGYLERMGFLEETLISRWTIGNILQILALGWCLLQPKLIKSTFAKVPQLGLIVVVVMVTTGMSYLITILMEISVPYSVEWRIIVQIVSFLSDIAIGAVIANLIIFRPQYGLYAVYFSLALAGAGVIWQVWQQGVTMAVESRLFGWNGEPKGLALFIVPSLVGFSHIPIITNPYRLPILFSLTVVLAFTFSATGAIAIGVGLFVGSLMIGKRQWRTSAVFILVVIFILIGNNENMSEKLFGRVGSRLSGESKSGITVPFDFGTFGTVTIEGTEAPILHLIQNEPLVILTGNGYGLATVYAHKYLLNFDSGFLKANYDGYITPNLAVLTNITNFGLLILLMMASRIVGIMKYGVRGLERSQQFFFIYFLTIFWVTTLIKEISISMIIAYVVLNNLIHRPAGENILNPTT